LPPRRVSRCRSFRRRKPERSRRPQCRGGPNNSSCRQRRAAKIRCSSAGEIRSSAFACLASMQITGNPILFSSVHNHVDVAPVSSPIRTTCGACNLMNVAIASGSLRARPFLSDRRCRSKSVLATRLVRHSVPLRLSIIARPHEVGLVDSWRADSQSLSMARARNYPMCENVREQRTRRIVFSPFFSFDCDCQCCSFPIQRNRDKPSTRKFDLGVFTQPGPLSDIDLCAQQSSAGSFRRFQTPRLSRYGAPLELKDHTHGG
jgi:hypothetical protein